MLALQLTAVLAATLQQTTDATQADTGCCLRLAIDDKHESWVAGPIGWQGVLPTDVLDTSHKKLYSAVAT